jgi:signal transduction histidine kinase/DNA-binding response OmpR family regulator
VKFLASRRGVVALFLALGLVPLALLAYVAVTSSTRALDRRVKAGLSASATIGARYIDEQLRGLAEVDGAFAGRPVLIRALSQQGRYDQNVIRQTLRQLSRVRPGIGTAFLADPSGKLIDVVPPTPEIVGKNFSYRDWYQGVTRTGRPYVSEAYMSLAKGHPLVVAVAAPVRSNRSRLGILVVAYRLDTIRRFAQEFARDRNETLQVTDQGGVLLTGPPDLGLRPLRDPRVAAALAGRAGISETEVGHEETVSAYAPVPRLGWTVTTQIPARTALADVRSLRWRVLSISLLLGLVFIAGVLLLDRVLRQRQRAEEETRRALDEVAREASINRAVLDATDEGILLVDRDGNVLVTNSALDRMRTEAFGMPAGGNVFADSTEVARRLKESAGFEALIGEIAADADRTANAEIELADSGRSFAFSTAPVRDGGGKLVGRIFSVRETTEARRVDQLKSELVATVSHELRTPLTGILGFAELLSNPALSEETRARYVDTIVNEARRLTGLVNDFLDLQRIEVGHFALRLELFEAGDVLRQQADLYSGQSSAHSVELSLPDEPIAVLGEQDRIAQVVGNLLSNAIKYSPDGGKVQVATRVGGGVARFEVRDDGLGIPAAQHQDVFKKFFRADSSNTRRIGGTGLGLALCREIVEAHGGRIGFESEEGKGSTFWFELPSASTAGNGDARKPRVLVVEDDVDAAALLVGYLSGYQVDTAVSGEEALEVAFANPPDLVCLDLGLFGSVDGWEVLSRLKADERTAAVPVVLCSASSNRKRAAALGAADFLTKPFSRELLHEAIRRVLPRGRGSVLVVDDDQAVRHLVAQTLGADGLELYEAADGEEALALAAEQRPDAIVLDLNMPGLDGLEVLERLQGDPELRDVPVVVLTAKTLGPEERERLQRRAVSLLEKTDYSAQELRRLVGQALGE